MKLKVQFILYLLVLHGIIAYFAFDYFLAQPYWFLLIEAVLIISAVIAFRIYSRMVRPLDLIASGIQSIRDRDFAINFRKSGSRELDGLISVFNQMMEQLRTERRIQQEQHFFLKKLMDAAPVGIIILDGNERIREVNPAASRMLITLPEVLHGKRPGEIPGPLGLFLATLIEDQLQTVRLNGMKSYRIIRGYFMNLGFRNTFLLIDELTNEMLSVEKEAFGKVIRMMSHEVNNSTGATNSLLQSLLQNLRRLSLPEAGQTVPASIHRMEEAIGVIMERHTHLNRFMNNLADVIRLPAPTLETKDLAEFCRRTAGLMEPFCRQHTITLESLIPDHPFLLKIDAAQIEQLLVNAIRNAVESIGDHGTILLVLDPESKEIRIEDTGRGISPEVREKLFTPFFSSKKHGQGIGLTLSREIAHNHGFGISLKNREEGGAVFVMNMDS